jgi:hypothetical protein
VSIHVDSREPGLVRVVMRGDSTDAELDAYHDEMTRLLRRACAERRKFAFLIDGRLATAATAARRRKIARWVDANAPLIKGGCSSMAMVLANALQRGVFKALTWLRPYPVVHRIFSNVEDAEAWSRSMMSTSTYASL